MMPLARFFSIFLVIAMSLGQTLAPAGQARVSEIESARRAYWEGRFEAAIAELEPLLGQLKAPKSLRDAAFLLGLNYLALGQQSKGEDYFTEAIIFDPGFTPSEDIYPPDIIETYGRVRARATGKVLIQSIPSRATVHMGGRAVGTTPYMGTSVTGEHTVRVELEGYSGQAQKVRVTAGETQNIHFELGREVPAAPTVRADPSLPVEEFDKIKLLVQDGEKTKERDATLRLEGDSLVVLAKKGRYEMKRLPYHGVRAAEYSYSKHPRWKEGLGAAVAVGIFAAPVFFLKGKKHWLTVQTETDYAVIRLDKRNYEVICLSFEAHSGVRVEPIGEK
jgi:hypothetical protein